MKHLKLWALVTGLALASLVGCSAPESWPTPQLENKRRGPSRTGASQTFVVYQMAQSPGKIRKSQQKAKAAPTPRNQQKTLQANDENHPL